MTSLDTASSPEPSDDTPPFTVPVEPGSELETLLTMHGPLKQAADKAEADLEAVKGRIKLLVTEMAPEGTSVIYIPRSKMYGPMMVSWKKMWQFPVAAFKKLNPEIYVRFAEQKGRWQLDQRKDG